jgi:phage baseplate assembly protein V
VRDHIERIWKRLRAHFALGQVTKVDDTGPVQLIQAQVGYLELHDKLPAVQHYGFVSNPPVGTDVILHFTGGDRSNGVVAGTNSNKLRIRNLNSGETVIHDDLGRQIYLSAAGVRVLAQASPVTIENATTITATATVKMRVVSPLLECTGDVIDNCDTQTETLASGRTLRNSHTHKVRNIQTGGSVVETDVPDQQET